MMQADLGIVPKRRDSFGNEAFSTKILEFMAAGLPVVASDTKIDRLYFNDDMLCFFTSGNPQSLADSLVKMHDDAMYRERLLRNAFEYIAKNNWRVKQWEYMDLVKRLTGKKVFTEKETQI
jgi:glycosyltransferase involved in cell wall biosynthesis